MLFLLKVQYQEVKRTHNRKDARLILKQIVKDLSSEVYGSIISKATARKLITGKMIPENIKSKP